MINNQPDIRKYRLDHLNGTFIELSNLGASWLSWIVPDKSGLFSDVLLGYPDPSDYLLDNCYMGATVGRFANRIKGASFSLNDEVYFLEKNDGENTNHGGYSGLHRCIWEGGYDGNRVVFRIKSSHLEGGYPGNIDIKVSYGFTSDGDVSIDFEAMSDRPAILNLTNHAYFNLSGAKDILQHEVMIPSRYILETDSSFIPTGGFIPVDNTEFDFRQMKKIGQDINRSTDQLLWNRGYNHCYVLSRHDDGYMKVAASVYERSSGRRLDVFTTYPGVLFYSAGYLTSEIEGKNGLKYIPSQGLCMETQYFPDTPNHPEFPRCIISPEKPYHHTTLYKISVSPKLQSPLNF